MKRIEIIGTGVFLILSIIFIINSNTNLKKMERHHNQVTFINTYDSVYYCVDELDDISPPQNKIPDENKIFWGNIGKGQLANEKLKRNTNTPIIAAYGQLNVMLDISEDLSLNEQECVIGELTSNQLFGGEGSHGLLITYNGVEYKVVDIISDINEVFIYNPTSDEKVLHGVTISPGDKQFKQSIINEYREKYMFDELFDYEFFILISQIVSMIAYTLFVILFLLLIRIVLTKRMKHYTTLNIKKYYILTIVILVIIIGVNVVNIPRDMLPPKWSDFEFWNYLFSNKFNAIEILLMNGVIAPDVNFIGTFIKVNALSLSSIICIFIIIIIIINGYRSDVNVKNNTK